MIPRRPSRCDDTFKISQAGKFLQIRYCHPYQVLLNRGQSAMTAASNRKPGLSFAGPPIQPWVEEISRRVADGLAQIEGIQSDWVRRLVGPWRSAPDSDIELGLVLRPCLAVRSRRPGCGRVRSGRSSYRVRAVIEQCMRGEIGAVYQPAARQERAPAERRAKKFEHQMGDNTPTERPFCFRPCAEA